MIVFKRPLAVVLYCAAFLVVTIYGLVAVSIPSYLAGRPTAGDILLGLTPLLVLSISMLGFWFMRWWGLVGLGLVSAIVLVIAPIGAGWASIWSGVVLFLAPLVIAWTNKRRFRW